MPVIFTTIATAIWASTALAGTWVVGATAFALQMAVGVGLNLIAAAIKGKPEQDKVGIQGKLTAGGDVPRSVMLGWYNTAGSLVYRGTFGKVGDTPNAYYVEVRALADYPVSSLQEVWVDGENVELIASANWPSGFGADWLTSKKHIKYGTKYGDLQHLWFRFYDGTQTVADPTLVNWFGGSERPWGSDRVGKGVPYVIIIALRDDLETENALFNGFPQCKFTLQGAKLYDPSKDSTVGGSGSQRYADPSTWGGDGDNLPAVQIYNILRGFRWNGQWLYGLQTASPAILPAANWIAAINKCRSLVDGPNGQEAQYRSGAQADVNISPADLIESLLKTCNGRLTEVGGSYTIHVGEPESPVVSFSDDDILSSEEQTFNPFRGLSDSINGASAKYPEPLEGWNVKTSPTQRNAAQKARDGNRELLADVDLSAVPYTGQVQRLLKSALLEAIRERRHTIVMPPWAQCLEPGDIVPWTSARNGYVNKWFRIDGMAYKANLDVMLQLTEVDPSDYDWNQSADYVPPTFSPMQIVRPAPQPMSSWDAAGLFETSSDGRRRVYVLLSWDGSKKDINGVSYEIAKTANELDVILRENSDNAGVGSIKVYSQGLLPGTTVYARGRYIPTTPRAMDWSDWRPVQLPDIRQDILDFEAGVRYNITELENKNTSELLAITDAISERLAYVAARLEKDRRVQNQQSADHRIELIDRIELVQDEAEASIEEVRTIATGTETAFGAYQITVDTRFDDVEADVATNATAISTLDTSFGSYQTTVNTRFVTAEGRITDAEGRLTTNETNISTNATAISDAESAIGDLETAVYSSFGGTGVVAKVTSEASTLASLSSSFSSFQTSATATMGTNTSSITAQGTAISTLNGYAAAQYAVTLNNSGYATGFNLVNGGSGYSSFTIVADKIKFQLPGYNGGSPKTFLTTGTVNGTAAIGVSGDFYLDGTFNVKAISAGAISTTYLAINSVGIDQMIANATTNTPVYSTSEVPSGQPDNYEFFSESVNIQGGKAVVTWSGSLENNGTGYILYASPPQYTSVSLYVDSTLIKTWKFIWTLIDQSGSSYKYSIFTPFTVQKTVWSLSKGSHTFKLQCSGFTRDCIKAGEIFIADYRNG